VNAARRREANRANARASTGPKTRAGKARSAGNARRHGLSLPALEDPALAHEIVALARMIAGAEAGAFSGKVDFRFSAENATTQKDLERVSAHDRVNVNGTRSSARRFELACRIAAAQLDLVRVRRARLDLLRQDRLRHDLFAGGVCDAGVAMELWFIDRYERRALSRRRWAIVDFDAAAETAPQTVRPDAAARRAHLGQTNPRCSTATAADGPRRDRARRRRRRDIVRGERLCAGRSPGLDCPAQTMRPRHEVRHPREDMMTKSSAMARRMSRRKFMVGTAGAGAALASNLAAPGLLAQTRAPIKLGNLNSFTGAIAYAAENNLIGMNLFFDSVGWTVGGRKIEIIKEDDQFNPQVGLQKAKKLVESDKVDMIVGVQASNVALAVLNYAKQQKAFYIVSGAGTDAITWDRYPYLFRTSISAYQLSTPMANWVYDNLGKEIVTTASDYAGGRDVIAQFKGPYVARGGKVLKEIWPPLGTTDFSPYLIDIKSINPPVTYDFMPGADAIRFIQQYTEFGLKEKMPLTGFTIIDSLTISALGKAALGVISATTYTDTVDNPQSKQFVADYQGKYKALPDIFSDYGYVAARTVYEALKATDGDASNKDKLAEAMTKVKFDAPRGPFRMDPVTHNPIEDIHICQVVEKDGKVTSKVITTFKDVQDPGKKIY
jgi:branched-chain amino acid transport system substrate-binding protein